MKVFKNTVKDLFQSAYTDIFGRKQTTTVLSQENNDGTEKKAQSTVLPGDVVVTVFSSVPGYYSPKIKIDSIVAFLPYGYGCNVIDCKDAFVLVPFQKDEVWVSVDAVTKSIQDVHPDYALSKNTSIDISPHFTTALRVAINDIFSMGQLEMSLQNVEYVWYRLKKMNISFSWPDNMRPRQAGRWSSILRQQSSMYVGTVPMSGVVLECYDSNNTPQIFFVESVTPDEEIVVSGIEAKTGKFYYHVDVATIFSPKPETLQFICNK